MLPSLARAEGPPVIWLIVSGILLLLGQLATPVNFKHFTSYELHSYSLFMEAAHQSITFSGIDLKLNVSVDVNDACLNTSASIK